VIHLESLAVGNPESYGKANNAARFEDQQEAARLEQATSKFSSVKLRWWN